MDKVADLIEVGLAIVAGAAIISCVACCPGKKKVGTEGDIETGDGKLTRAEREDAQGENRLVEALEDMLLTEEEEDKFEKMLGVETMEHFNEFAGLYSAASYYADIITDLVFWAHLQAHATENPQDQPIATACLVVFLIPHILIYLGVIVYCCRRDRDNENYYTYIFCSIVFGAPLILVFDVLMLCNEIPGIQDTLEKSLSDEFASFLATYGSIRTLSEATIESIPQIVIELIVVAMGLDDMEAWIIVISIPISLVDLALNWFQNVAAARKMKLSVGEYIIKVMQMGGDKFQNILIAMEKDQLDSVDLDDAGLTTKQLEVFSELLKDNTTVVQLEMRNNRGIEMDAYKALGEGIKENSGMERLYMNGCLMGDQAVLYLCKGLTNIDVAQGIIELNISFNNIGPDGGKAIGKALCTNEALQKLYIAKNQIGDEGLEAIADGLSKNTSLNYLMMEDNQITDVSCKYLKQALASNTYLHELYIGHNNITILGLTDLVCGTSKLGTLDACYNSISAEPEELWNSFIEALSTNNVLRNLDLNNNPIGPNGGHAIAKIIERNHHLESIDLLHCKVGNQGARDIAESIQKNATLKSINLAKNEIDDKGALDFVESLGGKTLSVGKISFGSNNLSQDAKRKMLTRMKDKNQYGKVRFDDDMFVDDSDSEDED